jgi:hypothetical protein
LGAPPPPGKHAKFIFPAGIKIVDSRGNHGRIFHFSRGLEVIVMRKTIENKIEETTTENLPVPTPELTPTENELAQKISATYEQATDFSRRAVACYVQAGKDLVKAQTILGHGNWTPFVENKLYPQCGINMRKAELLMAIAQDPVISNASNLTLLPTALSALYEARTFGPRLQALLDRKKIEADTTAGDIREMVADLEQCAKTTKAMFEEDLPLMLTWLKEWTSAEIAEAIRNLD